MTRKGHNQAVSTDGPRDAAELSDNWAGLTAGLLRDFNTMFLRLTSYAKSMEQQCARNESLERIANQIIELTQQGKDLLEQIYEFAGKDNLRGTRYDIGKLLHGLMGVVKPLLPENIELRADIPPCLPLLAVEPMRFEQAVFNLLLNAREAIDGEGRIDVSAALIPPGAAETAALDPPLGAEALRIRVVDTGCGMTPEIRERACEPLFTTKYDSESAGLGLAIVSRVALENGGRIAIDSQVGSGTVFDIYFPVLNSASRGEAGAE